LSQKINQKYSKISFTCHKRSTKNTVKFPLHGHMSNSSIQVAARDE